MLIKPKVIRFIHLFYFWVIIQTLLIFILLCKVFWLLRVWLLRALFKFDFSILLKDSPSFSKSMKSDPHYLQFIYCSSLVFIINNRIICPIQMYKTSLPIRLVFLYSYFGLHPYIIQSKPCSPEFLGWHFLPHSLQCVSFVHLLVSCHSLHSILGDFFRPFFAYMEFFLGCAQFIEDSLHLCQCILVFPLESFL